MSYFDVANSGFIYICVGIGLIIVLAAALYYLKICYSHALECGIEKSRIVEVMRSSVYFSIVPSIAIIIGLISLSTIIGVPYSWFRLSVIGSVTYEIMAANMAFSAIGVNASTATAETFGVVMFVMCLGITTGLIFNTFLVEKVHMGTTSMKNKDKRWGSVVSTVFMTSLILVLLVPIILSGSVSILTFVTSMLISVILTIIARKTGAGWMSSFTLAVSLIIAMASSILWTQLFS